MVTITPAPWYWITRRTALTLFFVFSFLVGTATGIAVAYWTWVPYGDGSLTHAVVRKCGVRVAPSVPHLCAELVNVAIDTYYLDFYPGRLPQEILDQFEVEVPASKPAGWHSGPMPAGIVLAASILVTSLGPRTPRPAWSSWRDSVAYERTRWVARARSQQAHHARMDSSYRRSLARNDSLSRGHAAQYAARIAALDSLLHDIDSTHHRITSP